MYLVAVLVGRLRPVVADRERKEVEHEVRVRDVLVRADEAPGLEVIRRARPAAEEQPARADLRASPLLQRGLHRDRLRGGVLDVDLEMVLQVLANRRQVLHDLDPELRQVCGVPDTGEATKPRNSRVG